MGEKKTTVCLCVFATLVIVIAAAGQAMVHQGQESNGMNMNKLGEPRGGPLQIWEDEFLNESKIDPNLSNNVLINTSVGIVSMENTFPEWTDPSFTRMKLITLTNGGQETFTDYDVNISVTYDSDMQSDFDDIRFTDGIGDQLSYYLTKKTNGVNADFLVKIPTIPPSQTTIYLFYGNPSAVNQSNFNEIFTWKERTSPDVMISFKAPSEGAWDPDVQYGSNRFLVTWEERLGPEDISLPLPHYERTIPGVIHGRSYNIDGGDPVPDNNSDIDVSDPAESSTFHAENPSAAFGAGKFFVTWEQNPANAPLQRYEADIKGALVTPDSQVSMRFTICSAANGQFNPQVAYDSSSGRFLVVWADARNGYADYDVRGRLYNSNGYPIGADFPIAYDAYYQGDPWVCSDDAGHFFIVYEDGYDALIGPFSLYAYRYDSDGNRIGTRITIATGGSTVDYIFPALSYNTKDQEFLITWNDGDISVDPSIRDSYSGNIWGKILNATGSVIKNNYIIEEGTNYIRSDSVPYFDTMFFCAYNGIVSGNQDIYGRLISSDGSIMTDRQELSDGSSVNVDWTGLAVGAGRIFTTWEDERDLMSLYADVFGYVWCSVQSIGSLNVTSSTGGEETLITTAQLMSIQIQPNEFREWRWFFFQDSTPTNTALSYDIMDQSGTVVLKTDVQNGQNVSDISASCIRLRATFTRVSAEVSPFLDSWNISALVGSDIHAPSTTMTLSPPQPDGNYSWYVSPITASFNVTDPDSDPENITTYYRINGHVPEIYHPESPPVISSNGPDNSIEYWSNDSINEEAHHFIQGIKIDTSPPMITLNEPPETISPGPATVNGSVVEYTTGSGINEVKITVNEETVFDSRYPGESKIWFEWNFTADRGETYDIFIEAWDRAGNTMEDRRTVLCPDRGVYETGYVYLFDNPKYGPMKMLVALGLSIAVDYNTLYMLLPSVNSNAASVKFIATQVLLEKEYDFWDRNMSDGCSVDLLVPFGMYKINAEAYDNLGTLIQEYPIITKMLIWLL